MAYNGSGTFLVNSSGQPVVTGTTISSTVFNALTADLATGLSTAICKDGQTACTARIPFIFGISSTLTTDSTSIGTGSILTSGGVGITKALWVGGLANIAGAVTAQSTLAVTGAATLSSTLQSTTYLSTSSIIYIGGTTASEVSLRRDTTAFQVKLGDSSAFADLNAAGILSTSGIIYIGGATSSEVSLRRSGTQLHVRKGDDSADSAVFASDIVASGVYYLSGITSNDVRLKKSTNFTLNIRRGDDSANGNLIAQDITCTGNASMNSFSGAGLTSVTVVNGVVTAGS